MPINLIAAMALNRVIGRDNMIPWKIPGEQKRFRHITEGHTVVMGRKTFESIGRPLPNRTNIILTHNREYHAPGCMVRSDYREIVQKADNQKIFIIGGEKIFTLFLPYAENIYLSILQEEFDGDTCFPEFPEADFQIITQERIDATIPYLFVHFQKKTA
ncbi:MAG: dihydrofolate reductase [Desulfobacteraceae bacterium]|nr:MAG: dihydrofolate reductase [Desulfobacteraceae bacterium]